MGMHVISNSTQRNTNKMSSISNDNVVKERIEMLERGELVDSKPLPVVYSVADLFDDSRSAKEQERNEKWEKKQR